LIDKVGEDSFRPNNGALMSTTRVGISAHVVADSIHDGSRLTTFEATFPRLILSEVNTHGRLSKNSASSRAVPSWKRLVDLVLHPFVPIEFGKNRAGMQATELASPEDTEAARTNWLVGRDVTAIQVFMLAGGESQILKDAKGDPRAEEVCSQVKLLMKQYPDVVARLISLSAGVHKQLVNRVLEPYAWHTVIITGTHWRNFYGLRASDKAQPEFDQLAISMARAHRESVPRRLEASEWHLPFVLEEDRTEITDNKLLARIASARCARVSYLTHDGKRNTDADFKMVDGLQSHGHVSPFAHPAMAYDPTQVYAPGYNGNFSPKWVQYRKTLENEGDFTKVIPREELLLGMKGDEELVDFVLSLPD
jgi:thymidylate synthase ThyX